MALYYKIFHVRRLTYWSGGRDGACECPGSNSSTTRWTNKSIQNSENIKQLNDLNKLLGQNFSINYHDKIPGIISLCYLSSLMHCHSQIIFQCEIFSFSFLLQLLKSKKILSVT